MLDRLKLKLAVGVLQSGLKALATSNNTRTTFAGLLAGAVLAIPGFDLGKLLAGDWLQVAHLSAGVAVWLLGYWATRANRNGHTTAAGAIAGALYAASGQVQAVVTGIILALAGYYTNQPGTTDVKPPEQ